MTLANYQINLSQGLVSIWDSKPKTDSNHPTVLFLHGHCTDKSFFSNQINDQRFKNYRLIAIDLPGYGESEPPKDRIKVYSFPGFADVITEAINTLHLNNLIVAGWSLGGHISLELTSRLPFLKGILITGTPPIEVSLEGIMQGFKHIDSELMACFGKGNLDHREAELLATISGYDYSDEKHFLVDAILNTDEGAKTIYPASISKGIGKNQREIVAQWPCPLAIVAAENDIAINYDYVMNNVTYKNLWRNQVQIVKNAGHAIMFDKPEEFNTLLNEFFDDIFS